MNDRGNPFKIGDKVVFCPNEHAIGWAWSSFDRLRIHPGDVGVVTEIVDDALFIDDARAGFSWECFKSAT
jgi:ATP-dependent exoDNAse (exonuclease V) alpha subunit